MLTGKSIIGKEVLSRADGEKIANVKDIIISKDHTRILALLTDGGNLFAKARMVPMTKVLSFGKDAVVVTDRAADMEAQDEPIVKESLDSKDKLVGKTVFTERGDEQAKVNDIYFDEASGNIVGLELAGGVLDSAAGGTAYLPVADIISIGQDAVVIKAEALGGLLEQASGLKNAPNSQNLAQ